MVAVKFSFKKNIIFYFILVIYAVVVYGNVVFNRYNLDDDFVIYKNSQVQQGIKAIPEIFTTNYYVDQNKRYGYRPLVKSTFAIEYELFGENPAVSHFINLIIYIITGILIFYLLKRIFIQQKKYLLFLITLLFISHPVHTEVVASLKNREELLSFLFGLLSLYFLLEYTDKKKWFYFPLSLLSFSIGYLSKESVIVFAAIIPLTLYYYKNDKIWKYFLYLGSFYVVYKLISSPVDWFLPSDKNMNYYENPLYFDKDFSTKLIITFQALYKYLYLLIIPFPLIFYYGFNQVPLTGLFDYRIILAIIVYISIFIVAIKQLKRKTMLSYGILFFLIAISMFSNFYVPVSGIVAERLIYASSLGFCIAFVAFLSLIFKETKSNKTSPLLIVIVLIIVSVFSVWSAKRNTHWKDYNTLFSHDIKYAKKSARANALYASYLLNELQTSDKLNNIEKRNYLNNAVKYFNKALDIYPEYFMALKNLGNINFVYFKDYNKAEQYYLKALKIDSLNADIYLNLGFIKENKNNFTIAEKYYNKAIVIDSLNINAKSLLANLYFKKGKMDKAIMLNKLMAKIDTNIDLPYINIGNYYLMSQDTVKAVEYWEKAIMKNKNNPDLLYGLFRYFKQNGDNAKSDYYYKIYMEINEKNK